MIPVMASPESTRDGCCVDAETHTNGSKVEAPAARWRRRLSRAARSVSVVRAVVQGLYLLLFVWAAIEFHAFYAAAVSGAPAVGERPELAEAFLPISALLGLRRLLQTGLYDMIHPAGLTILIGAIVSAAVARKAFCSWVCPIGALSRGLAWLGEATVWRHRRGRVRVPWWLDKPLAALKYLLLAFFVWAVFFAMPSEGVQAFLSSPYNRAADAKMLLFFVNLSGTAASTLLILLLVSVLIKNAWCRYLCPYGALLGLFSWLSPLHVVRDSTKCTDCQACTRVCPVEIPVHRRLRVLSPECTGCMSCVQKCPQRDCLTVSRRGSGRLSPFIVPVAALAVILGLWGWARLTGHWTTSLTKQELVDAYRGADEMGHP